MLSPLDWLDDALADLDRRGLRRELRVRTTSQRGDRIEIDAQSLVNFGSNDYLGLAGDPRIAAAARSAIESQGWGAGASPLVTGYTSLHAHLERELAAFESAEAALLFPSGYAANIGAITSLVGKGDAIYSDELNHASIIDGCRLSGAAIHVYPHRDVQKLGELLCHGSPVGRRLVVTESLFSMGGDVAPLAALTQLAREFNTMLLVDEAHATGLFGERGRGLCDQAGVAQHVSARVGTLSKALASVGGFVAGSQRLINWLKNRARPYVFSTATPPAAAAAASAALKIVRTEPERRETVHKLAGRLRQRLAEADIACPASNSQIVSIVVGDSERAMAISAELRRRGFLVPAIRPPSVPEGQSLLRISLTYLHTEQQIGDLVAALSNITR
jgi:8-amino-7-oxononanoate synthase